MRWGLCLVVVALAGCGGSPEPAATATATPPPLPTEPVDVTRAWADAVRANDLERAGALFRLPAVVSNATPPLRLTDPAQLRAFHASFPCGAVFVRAREEGRGQVLSTYTLTERRGATAPCGSGALGARVGVLFTIRDGRIVRWIRADPDDDPTRPPAQPPEPQV